MNPIQTFVTSLSAAALTAAAVAQPVVLQPGPDASNDVTVYRAGPDSNFNDGTGRNGGFNQLLSATRTQGDAVFESHEVQALVSFDLPALTASVTGVELGLYNLSGIVGFPISPATAPRPVDVSVFAFAGAGFDETTATWNTPGFTRDAALNPADLGPALDTVAVDAAGAWFTFDVTAAVRAAVEAGRTQVGFVLASQTVDVGGANFTASGLIAASGEYGDAALRPRLVLNTVPEPAAAVLLGVGAYTLVRRRRRA